MALPLHVYEFGAAGGLPLLALHGVAAHGARWRAFAHTQLGRFQVVAPDLRGHGRSTPLPPWTLEQHAADLLAVLDALGLDAVPVLAHAFGSAVALHLTRLAPGRVSKLVLLDPAVALDPQLALRGANQPPRVHPDRRSALAAQRREWPFATDEVIADELREHLERTESGWRFRYSAPAAATAWSEMTRAAALPAPGTPTLVVRALREQYVTRVFLRGAAVALGADFNLVDLDCGHLIHLERPVEVGSLVDRFIGHG